MNRFAEIQWATKDIKTMRKRCPYPSKLEIVYLIGTRRRRTAPSNHGGGRDWLSRRVVRMRGQHHVANARRAAITSC